MTDTSSEPTHPGLTVKVYRVNPATMERTPVLARTLKASDQAMTSSAFPPCECPRHRQKGGRR